MNKLLQIKSNIESLESEFYTFSSLYNLHIIEVKNTFSHSILEAYEDTFKDEFNVATLFNSNQIIFYYTPDKRSKIINMSLNMFHNIWKIFLKKIEAMSIVNISNEFYQSFKDKDFTSVTIKKVSSANVYFKLQETSTLHSRNLEFSYKPRNLKEREFILKNNDIWLHISSSLRSKLLNNKEKIAVLSMPMVIKTNPFSGAFTHKIVFDLTSKIKAKSSDKIDIKIVNVNEIKKIVTLKIDIFLPISFMDYIKEYVSNNTLYEVIFANIKQEK
ncbi:hypothetical protein [Sulfurimonas sp.]|uniref:hypothetical protein n=1 Tax=Sulfurimonas sp. TaxID=2022749 RepID=UPI0025FCF75C|nr:hypothetical protein [Sulfurimonas sp.]